jgi:hypothetical protein
LLNSHSGKSQDADIPMGNGHAIPDSFYRPLLCELYKVTPSELGFGYQTLPEHLSTSFQSADELLCKTKFTRDDLESLSQKFDDALARSSVDDVNLDSSGS